MIMSRFRSMGLAAGAAASVLSCYMVSLRVARERGEVQRIEQQIADADRDIRDLKTELGTRGRMRQLERWNSDVLALSAPGAAQYLNGSVELASYQPAPVEAAPAVVTAAVTTAAAQPVAVARAIPAVEVKPATHDAPKLMTASYKPKATKKKDSDSGPVRVASAKSKATTKKASADKQTRLASAKSKATTKSKASNDKQLRLASAKTRAKSKSADAKLLRTASFKPKASKAGGPNAGLIHTASYVTNRKIGPTRVALLDDVVLHDIGRAAAHEGKTGRKAVP
jgi:hypothetical protein